MTDDPALLRLLVAADDGRGQDGPGRRRPPARRGRAGGAFEGLVDGANPTLCTCSENVRQHDPAERHVLEQLRAGDVGVAVDWYAGPRPHPRRPDTQRSAQRHGRRLVRRTCRPGRRGDVRLAAGQRRRPEPARPPTLGRRRPPDRSRTRRCPAAAPYAAGDRIVTLAPGADGRLVTSQTGTVIAVDPAPATLERGWTTANRSGSRPARPAPTRLDYGYALTVHRSQGATVDVGHRYSDGGGRELAYVSMCRARQEALVYVVADDVDQAKGDLKQDWSHDRRQRWAIDTGTPTTAVADVEHEPEAPTRLQAMIREARLRSERDAVASAIPADVGTELHDASRHLAALEARCHDLETGGPAYWQTPEGRAGAAVHRLSDRLDAERRRADDPELSRSQQRSAGYEIRDLTPQLDDALEHWKAVCGAEHARLIAQIDRLAETVETLQERYDHRLDWLDRHPEAVRRLERLDRGLDAYRPEPVQRVVGRAIANDAPTVPLRLSLTAPTSASASEPDGASSLASLPHPDRALAGPGVPRRPQ